MRFTISLLAVISGALAAAVPTTADATDLFPLVQAWNQADHKGNKFTAAVETDVAANKDSAKCFGTPHGFISSMVLTGIGRPYGCELYVEDNCAGESRHVQMQTWADVSTLSNLANIGFDKRTASFKCFT